MQPVLLSRLRNVSWPMFGKACRGTPFRPIERTPRAPDQADPALALEDQQVERRSLTGQPGKQDVSLAAVMGLVVEEVDQQRREILLDLHRVARCAITDGRLQAVI